MEGLWGVHSLLGFFSKLISSYVYKRKKEMGVVVLFGIFFFNFLIFDFTKVVIFFLLEEHILHSKTGFFKSFSINVSSKIKIRFTLLGKSTSP